MQIYFMSPHIQHAKSSFSQPDHADAQLYRGEASKKFSNLQSKLIHPIYICIYIYTGVYIYIYIYIYALSTLINWNKRDVNPSVLVVELRLFCADFSPASPTDHTLCIRIPVIVPNNPYDFAPGHGSGFM